ncbi:carboxylesterase [Ruegeria marisrubri]|uniref:Carboxylesterase n=1 Tax=Ruegeria marisrubri TaxID=1685379 RepID=A0A124F5N9_9RHOB|nr:holin family protein [Ruegeria marisrubri]KUJ85845.1 carboxylesterase [Ruegeria marisrubri]
MGLISTVLTLLFGGERNVLRETAEVFRENAESGADRAAVVKGQAMAQFAAEFATPEKGRFDRFMDGVNRLPRPALALGTLGLFVAAMVNPLWFAEHMQGLALVPEPLWWLLGVVVSFYFGARHQAKAQELQREVAGAMFKAPQVVANIAALRAMRAGDVGAANPGTDSVVAQSSVEPDANPALDDWRRLRQI